MFPRCLYLDGGRRARVLALLLAGLAVAKEHETVGLSGPEVKGDRPRLLRRPLAERHKGLRRVKSHGVQRRHTLTLEGHHAANLECRRVETGLLVTHCAPPPRSQVANRKLLSLG